MADIIDMTERLPHGAHYVVCMACARDWVAVVPHRVSWPLECPKCGQMHGEKIAYSDPAWFKRFMAGDDQARRTMVLLNAKRMADKNPQA